MSPVSTPESEHQAGPKRHGLLSGFTRPSVLGGKKQAQQRQATASTAQTSPNQTTSVALAVTAVPIGNSSSSGDGGVQQHKRAATSLGHHTRSRQNTTTSIPNAGIQYHQPRQSSYEHARTSAFASGGMGIDGVSYTRHSHELGARTIPFGHAMQQQQLSRTSSSLDGQYMHTLQPLDNGRVSRSQLQQDNPQAHQDRLIDTLLNKLVTRLPHRTHEKRLTSLYTDDHGTEKIYSTIQQLSRHRLCYILHQLHNELEQVVKLPTRPENQIPHYSQDPLDSLRSEALLLRMAAGCLEWHWENTIPKDTNPPPLDDKTAKQLLGTVTFFLRQYYAASYGINNPFYDASSLNSSSQTSNRQQRNSESSTPLVTSVTSPASVSGKFISQERATPASTASPNVSLSKRFRKTSHTTPAALNETLSTSPDFSPHLRRLNAEIQKRKQHAFSDTVEKRSQEAILHDCLISCASIIRYISASRWEMILTRIRSKFSVQWSAVSSANNNTISQDDIPEMSEIHLLEFSHFDETRLSSILSELSISFGSLRKTAQPVIAVMLHDILERYMVENPKVFHSMYEDGKRRIFAGQPEALFDAIFSVGDTAKRRNSTWPTLSILLTLCPEIVMQIAMGGGDTRSPMLSKKVLFLDALRKAVRFSSSVSPGDNHSMTNDQNIIGAESRLALICYAEICTAASYSKPIQGRPLPPLWILAEEMEMEIKKRCLDVTRICYCQDGRIDKSLISSAIIAIGRLSFDTLKKDIIPSFLHPRTALQTQIATLTALHSLLNGSGIDETSLIEASCIPLTKLLHQTVTSTFGTSANGMRTLHTTSARSLQIMGDFESERNQVIMAILQIFLSKPYMILHQPDGSSQLDLKQRSLQPVNELVEFHPFDTGQLLAIFACLMHDDNHILVQSAVKDLFLLLMNTQTSVKAASDDDTSAGDTLQRDQAGFLYPHLNVIALALVRPCMAPQDPEHVDKIPYKAFLRFLKQLECTQSLQEGISKNVEIVLHLCEFIGLSILPLADENLRDLAAEILQAGALIAQAAQNTSSSMIELGKAIKNDKTPAVKGHMAQMERSLKVASAVDKCSPALPLVWFQLYGQWKRLAEAYGVVEVDTQAERTVGGIEMSFMQLLTPNEENTVALIQISGFLVTLAGLVHCRKANQPSLNNMIPVDYLAEWIYQQSVKQQDIVDLLTGVLRLAISEHPRLRDAARDFLGQNLNPDLLQYILAEMALKAESLLRTTEQNAGLEEASLYFDQTLTILTQSARRLAGNTSLSIFTCDHIERHLLLASKYTKRLGRSVEAIWMKTKVCQASHAVLDKRTLCASSLSDSFRNTLAAYLLSFVDDTTNPSLPEKDRKALQISATQALAVCFDDLCISRSSSENTGKTVASDLAMIHSYFHFLVNVLHKEELQQPEHSWNARGSLERRAAGPASVDSEMHSEALRKAIILAVSNLLASNYPKSKDVLAKLCVPSDIRIDMNLAILSATLPRIQNLSIPKSRKYASELIDMISAPDLSLALAIVELCTGSEHEGVLDLLLYILSASGLATKFLKAVVEQEISTTEHESTLFRGNSVATRLLTTFARTRGYSYLRFLISNLLSTLAQQPLDLSDMDMYTESSEVGEGLLRLENLTQAFLGLICETSYLLPAEIQEICHHIQLVVRDFFPDSVYTAIGGWIFLRYINPAVISPEIVDLELPEESRKALIMISKLLQALSNNIRFKEPGMKSLNGFISKHILDMTTFLTQICSISASQETAVSSSELLVSQSDQDILCRFLWKNKERIGSALLTRHDLFKSNHWQGEEPNGSPEELRRVWLLLVKNLENVKEATESSVNIEKGTSADGEGSKSHTSATYTFCPTETYNAVFRTGAKSQRGHPTVCIVLRAITSATSDLVALCDIFTKLKKSMHPTQIEVILDCTGFREVNEVPPATLQLLVLTFKTLYTSQLDTIFIFSPSSSFVFYFRKLLSVLPIAEMESKIRVIQDAFELEDHFPSPSVVLAPSTLTLMNAERTLVTEATYICPEGLHVRCQIRIGPRDLHILATRKRTLCNDIKIETQDYISAQNIAGVYHRRRIYGTVTFDICLTNGVRLVLLDVEEPDVFVKAVEALLDSNGPKEQVPLAPNNAGESCVATEARVFSVAISALASADLPTRQGGQKLWYERTQALDVLAGATRKDCQPDSVAEALSLILQRKPDIGPALLKEVLQSTISMSESSALQVLIMIKPLLTYLVEPMSLANAESRILTVRSMELLLELSLSNRTALCYSRLKIWPMVLKCEYLVDLFLETAQLVWSKVDIDEGRKEAVRSILGLAPGPVVSSKISIKMQSSIWAAAATDTVAFDQAIEWPQIMLLADLSQYVNQDHGLASAANLWDLIWIYCMLAGLGSEEDASKLGHSVHASFCALQTSASHEYQAELDVLLEDWKRLQALQQVDVMEQLQDGYISQVPTLMHKVISEIVQAGLALAPSDDTKTYWSARCASTALRCAWSATGIIQYRSLLVMAQFPIGPSIVLDLMHTLSSSLAEDINSNTLQAYMFCFISALRNLSDISIAARLFWLGVGVSQAHPLLFATSTLLVEAAVSCLMRTAPGMNFPSYLLDMQTQTQDTSTSWEEFEDVLEVHFTEENFSFALSSLFAKGLQHQDTYEQTTTLLRTLARMSVPTSDGQLLRNPSESGSAPPSCTDIGHLGYTTAALPIYAREISGQEHSTWSTTQSPPLGQYQPVLGKLDIEKNEPLVLAASLTMSHLYVSTAASERMLLLQYMLELADISPAVVLLLAGDLIPLLTNWLQESTEKDLFNVTEALLSTLVSSPSTAQLNGLDITAYVSALGLPKLLECASFFDFLSSAVQNTDIARNKLRCCADLLGAFLNADERMTTSS